MIKAKFKAVDKGQSEIEEATFANDEIELFELFCKNYERLKSSRIFENGFPVMENLNICSENGIDCKISNFDQRDIYELLHVLRPFILAREPASFERVISIFGKNLKSKSFRASFKQIRQLFSDGEHSFLVNISCDGTSLFSNRLFNAWLNGHEYHGDAEKQELMEELEGKYGKSLVQGSIISILKGRVKAIGTLHKIVKIPLKMGINA